MNTPARIDVLISAYNAEATVREAVGSIQAQTVRDIRIIVIDDGSTDGTGRILAEIAAADPRVEVIATENRGLVSALNTALAASDAAILARFDADDVSFPDRFAVQLAYLDANPDCIAVAANAYHIDEAGVRMGTTTRFNVITADADAIPAREPYLLHPFLMVRRDALVGADGYRYAFHSEDSDLYWRLWDRGRLHSIPELLGEYRMHAASVSSARTINGRVAALSAQLAAISHKRRIAGRADFAYPADALQRYKALDRLDRIVAHAAGPLDAEERAWLEIAVAAKLLQLASYRPYMLDEHDCRYIRRALNRHWRLVSPLNRWTLWALVEAELAKQRRAGNRRAAWALGPGQVYAGREWRRVKEFAKAVVKRATGYQRHPAP